ncbi:MAG: type II toxin-antitoxin system prevent-host-death family antitoxin [Acidimicrobiia bacterium]|nr:type II toxin-antitoxin system prevent-host-death family antitoxin [Acidimicrobiia bacterium]
MTITIVSTQEAEMRLSELIRMVQEGDEVVVARNGQPVAKIIPWPPPRPERIPGAWAGKVKYHDDIVGSDEDVIAMFSESAESDTV